MCVTFLTTVTADGNAHGAESSKDVWRSDEKERVNLVVAEGLDESGDEGGNSRSTGFGDDDATVWELEVASMESVKQEHTQEARLCSL